MGKQPGFKSRVGLAIYLRTFMSALLAIIRRRLGASRHVDGAQMASAPYSDTSRVSLFDYLDPGGACLPLRVT